MWPRDMKRNGQPKSFTMSGCSEVVSAIVTDCARPRRLACMTWGTNTSSRKRVQASHGRGNRQELRAMYPADRCNITSSCLNATPVLSPKPATDALRSSPARQPLGMIASSSSVGCFPVPPCTQSSGPPCRLPNVLVHRASSSSPPISLLNPAVSPPAPPRRNADA